MKVIWPILFGCLIWYVHWIYALPDLPPRLPPESVKNHCYGMAWVLREGQQVMTIGTTSGSIEVFTASLMGNCVY